MKNTSLVNLSDLFQSNQGSRSPWFLFWLLVGIAVLAVIVAWWMKRGEADESPPAASGDTPAAKPAAAQAVAPAAEEASTPVIIEKTAEEEPAGAETDEPETEAPAEESPVEEPVEEAETPSEPEAPVEPEIPVEPDDLTKVEGIGPKISSLLQEQGISTYSQLANTSVEKLRQIMTDAKLRIAHPDTWPEQAALAAAGDWDGLDKLQDDLKGGRRA